VRYRIVRRYLPLLEETGYMAKEKYSFQRKSHEHAQRIGKHFELYKRPAFRPRAKKLAGTTLRAAGLSRPIARRFRCALRRNVQWSVRLRAA
jgi:hypothetical protein